VLSCTQPEGTCAKRGNDSTATAVNNINRVVIAASYCASKTPPPADVSVVRDCVNNDLKRKP
jgi:hypothetical protein